MKIKSWQRLLGSICLSGLILFVLTMTVGCKTTESAVQDKGDRQSPGLLRFGIHDHILPYIDRGETDFPGGARAALKIMNQYGIKKLILMPHPFIASQSESYTYTPLKRIARKYPERFLFFGGGGTLNVMLHQAVAAGEVSPALREKFEQTAKQIIADGASGFGEMVAEHFSMRTNHPYESAPADHPLLLLLSDIAARHNVVIDIHMEAIATDLIRPPALPSNNPAKFAPNIEQFERLLSHNRKTNIIWAHAGWDNTGHRTTLLMEKLLAKHPNLYMSIKLRKQGKGGGGYNTPLVRGELDEGWRALIEKFPDRFMIGNDDFYQPAQAREKRGVKLGGPERLLSLLPEELDRRVGFENAAALFKVNL